jgi:saccharopine dehydrogenase-like NADP-dependent oxidoreductase
MRDHLDAAAGDDLRAAFASKAGLPKDSLPAWNLHWLGMFSDRPVGGEKTTMLDAMGDLMFEKLAFQPGELDLIVLFHDFQAAFPDGHREHITSQLIDFGQEGGDSAMSRTVSLPAAIAAHMLLQGEITATGVLRPVSPGIYNPVLDELAALGIACREHSETY